MLEKIRNAINQLDVWPVARIKKVFQQESDKMACSEETQIKETCDLTKLLNLTDNLAEEDRIGSLIFKIDERIAELEAQGNISIKPQKNIIVEYSNTPTPELTADSLPEWIHDCLPRSGFSLKFSWEYAKALIKYCSENPESVNPLQFLSLPNHQFSNILSQTFILIRQITYQKKAVPDQIIRIKRQLSNSIKSFVKITEHETDERYILAFYLDILFLLLSIQEYTAGHSTKENKAEARRYLSYYLANGLYLAGLDPTERLSYAKESFALSAPTDRQDAFNILGLCALRSKGGKQLAYDTYLSWVQKAPLGLLTELWPPEFAFGSHEDAWRESKNGSESLGTMCNNFAYICDSIAKTYELKSPERKRFHKIAIEYISKAIEKKEDSDYYRTYGLILADLNTPDKSSQDSLAQYAKAMELSDKLHNRLPAKQLYCDAMIDELLAMLISSKQDYHQWSEHSGLQYYKELQKQFQDYSKMVKDAQNHPLVDEDDKRNVWESFFEMQHILQTPDDSALELGLLLIHRLAWNIKKFLRRNAYSSINYYTRDKHKDVKVNAYRDPGRSIAYYTTIKTAMYLFNVLYRSNRNTAPKPVGPKDSGYELGINCLTMMQAYYMNDPYEGLSFERGISGHDPNKNILFYQGNAWQFREDIFQKNFVFLKSFTDRMDNLLMWNRYGSDREIGSRDSNGCCIRFAPEFFDRVNDVDTTDTSSKLLVDKDDDYSLYRVVYLNQLGEIENSKNPKLDRNAKRCYELLKQLLRYVNSELYGFAKKNPDDPRIIAVRSYVQAALNPVIFLFKDDEYSDEQEYRLVVSRSHQELDNIRMLSGEPEKACINPYFQICIDKVIFGPNVENPEHWFNHFRYHIACMWRRALGPGAKIPGFTIEKSNIHYHT